MTKNRKCVLCGTKLESAYEYCPNCGGSTKKLEIRRIPIVKLVAFNVVCGLVLLLALGVIGILMVIIIDLIFWYLSPKN